jgi:hypothetical protein
VTSVINRYYDPSTDQFLSIDPDVATTDQPYVFTNDNPLNSEDPEGSRPTGLSPFADRWPNGNLQDEVTRYLGSDVGVEEGSSASKIVFYDVDDPAKQVIYDVTNDDFRIARVSNGDWEYYDRENDTWGTNDELGSQGLENSHYANTGDTYSSADDAAQQLSNGGLSAGDDDGGDGGDDFGALGDLGLFLLFPSINQLVPPSTRPQKA